MIGGKVMKIKSSLFLAVAVLCLMLTSLSCSRMSVHWTPDRHKGFGPPPHAKAHGHRSKLPAGVEVVFDTTCGVYFVVGRDNHFWLDGHYYRFYDGQWELSVTIDGGWRAVDIETLPRGLRGKYKIRHVSKKHQGRGWGFGKD